MMSKQWDEAISHQWSKQKGLGCGSMEDCHVVEESRFTLVKGTYRAFFASLWRQRYDLRLLQSVGRS